MYLKISAMNEIFNPKVGLRALFSGPHWLAPYQEGDGQWWNQKMIYFWCCAGVPSTLLLDCGCRVERLFLSMLFWGMLELCCSVDLIVFMPGRSSRYDQMICSQQDLLITQWIWCSWCPKLTSMVNDKEQSKYTWTEEWMPPGWPWCISITISLDSPRWSISYWISAFICNFYVGL